MKKIFNIFKNKKTTKEEFIFDELLSNHNIEYSEIDFEKKETDVLKSFNNLNSKLNENSNYFSNLKSIIPFLNYKAILKPAYTIILTAIVIFAIIEFKEINRDVDYAVVTVDAGEKITLHITEDFTIWLNSGTTIKIPMELKRNAKIYLDGEAYFEIKNGSKKTPEIIANNIIFKTTEGAFNINTRYEGNQLIANIKSGNIEIYNPVLPKSTRLMVGSNERIYYNPMAEFIAIEKEKNINYLAWKTGVLKFDHSNLNEVSEILENYYGIPMVVSNPKLQSKKFTASFKNADIDDILEKLEITFNCEISGDGSKLIIN